MYFSWISATHSILNNYHLRLGLPSGLFPSGSLTEIFSAFLISLIRVACLVHDILLYLITLIISGEAYRLCSSKFRSLLQPIAISFVLKPNILLSTLFSNALNPCSSLSVRDQVLHPYKTKDEIMVLYILTFMFRESRQEGK